jgi:hypothetical protein
MMPSNSCHDGLGTVSRRTGQPEISRATPPNREKVRPVTYLSRELMEATFELPAQGKAIGKISK